jgi:hypothetical protein
MNRRTFLTAAALAPGLGLLKPRTAAAELPRGKITRVRIYRPPNLNPLFNQSNMVVTVETDIGITGIGEGGWTDTLEQCAGTLIGKNPFKIEAIWQEMYIAWFYPPGREKRTLRRSIWPCGQKARHSTFSARAAWRHRRDYCGCCGRACRPPGAARQAAPQERARDDGSGFRAFRWARGRRSATRHTIGGMIAQFYRRARGSANGGWYINLHQRLTSHAPGAQGDEVH